MSNLWRKIEFYKGKSGDCNCNWGLRQSPGVVSEDKVLFCFCFVNVFKAIKLLAMGFQNSIHGLRGCTSS